MGEDRVAQLIAAIDSLEGALAKQVARIGKASAAAAIEDGGDEDEALQSATDTHPIVIDLPPKVAAVRRQRPTPEALDAQLDTLIKHPTVAVQSQTEGASATTSPAPRPTSPPAATTSPPLRGTPPPAAVSGQEEALRHRVAELEAEIANMRLKHRSQLLAAERDLARLRLRAKGSGPSEGS